MSANPANSANSANPENLQRALAARERFWKTALFTCTAIACFGWAVSSVAATLSRANEALLEDMSHRSFQFFWEQSDPNTGVPRVKSTIGFLACRCAESAGSYECLN
jgi:hypothetical protein